MRYQIKAFKIIKNFIGLVLLASAGISFSKAEPPKAIKKITLSEESFLQKVLSSSPYLAKIKSSQKKTESEILKNKYSFYDWGLAGAWKTESQTNSEIDAFLAKEKEAETWSLSLQKKWPYGFQFNSSYLSLNEKNLNSELLKQFRPSDIYRKQFRLELRNNLTESIAHVWLFKSFESSLSLNDLAGLEQTEELALKALEQYWKTQIAWVSWKQAEEGIKIYQKLLRQINNKKKYNFLQPGERPQVLAEYESIQKTSDQAQQNYEREKKALLVFLNKESYEVDFKPKSIPAPPSFSKTNIETIRAVQIQNQKIEAQRLRLLSQKSSLFPVIEFGGIRGWTPVGESSKMDLFSDLSFYELGIQLKWVLFSKSAYENINQKKYELEESKIDLAIAKHQLKNQITLLEKQIPLAYKNIERAQKANRYHKQAFYEIQKSFEQGRVDIFQLIQIEKQIRSSELEKAIALSEYSLSLAGLLALKDKLLEKYIKL